MFAGGISQRRSNLLQLIVIHFGRAEIRLLFAEIPIIIEGLNSFSIEGRVVGVPDYHLKPDFPHSPRGRVQIVLQGYSITVEG